MFYILRRWLSGGCVITWVSLDRRDTEPRSERWCCETDGDWRGVVACSNWGIGTGRWKWLAYVRSAWNWWSAGRQRDVEARIKQELGIW